MAGRRHRARRLFFAQNRSARRRWAYLIRQACCARRAARRTVPRFQGSGACVVVSAQRRRITGLLTRSCRPHDGLRRAIADALIELCDPVEAATRAATRPGARPALPAAVVIASRRGPK